jgi:tetratricopeptide (TPR) repeat protein
MTKNWYQVRALIERSAFLRSHAIERANEGAYALAESSWKMATECEERLAEKLDEAGESYQAALSRVNAALCYEQLGNTTQALALLRMAVPVLKENDPEPADEEFDLPLVPGFPSPSFQLHHLAQTKLKEMELHRANN